MIIAIEGHDGVGKTTLAKALVARLGFVYIKHPIKDILSVDDDRCLEIIKNVIKSDSPKLIAWFLAFNDMCALNADENAILDRHSLLNYYWNGGTATEAIFELSQKLFGKPDLTLLLTASNEVRIDRIKKRDSKDADLKNTAILKADNDKLIDYLEKYKFNYTIIDTDSLTAEEVEDIALREISHYTNVKE